VFYSDGLTEAANADEEEYGGARLENHFLGPDASAESILQEVRAFATSSLGDDATVILIKGRA
jgi:phosphoserine phosphatase RsbU/P